MMMWFQNLYSVVFVVSMVASVSGHGAVTIPKPRQAVDGGVHPWNGTVPGPMPFMVRVICNMCVCVRVEYDGVWGCHH